MRAVFPNKKILERHLEFRKVGISYDSEKLPIKILIPTVRLSLDYFS